MTFHLLHFQNLPVLEQLRIEEALLRNDSRNFCVINEGSSPAIVLGISGKVEELVDLQRAKQHALPMIRRFSGGGTVVVDGSTLFVTFICQKSLHDFPCFSAPILQWSTALYKDVFNHPNFQLRENDYVLGEKKCGGNAQYFKKDRWLHHTSFLWDYSPELMQNLLHPKKTPTYRAGRNHEEFICRMKDYLPSQEEFLLRLKGALAQRYALIELQLHDIATIAEIPHRQATTILTTSFP